MNEQLASLIGNMEDLTQVLQQLCASADEKKRALVHNDVEALDQVSEAEWKLVESMGRIEKRRVAVAQLLSTQLGIEEPTLTAIGAKLEPGQSAEFGTVARALKKATDTLEHKNALNADLIQTHNDYVHYILDMTRAQERPSNIYDRTGSDENYNQSSIGLLNTEV